MRPAPCSPISSISARSIEDGKVHLAIAPRGAPGLTIIDNWSSFGQRTTASGNVLIDNVRVGPEAVIPAYVGGERPSSNGSVSQIIQAAVDAGIARGAIEDTIGFVRDLCAALDR